MSETRSQVRERITCEEEERLSQGYRIETFFSVPGGMETVQKAQLSHPNHSLLNIQYIPTARIYFINEGWRSERRQGFRVNQFGGWESHSSNLPSHLRTSDVQIFTYTNADALYLQPISALNLGPEGVVSLQYALKRGIETVFQIEPNELGVRLMGNLENPNIFLYETAEGSLGVLSQLVGENGYFHQVIKKAYEICRFDDIEYQAPASYEDLLSYYNQRDHQIIDRFAIREALEMMMVATVELQSNQRYADYEQHYQSLLNQYDKNSVLELKFLQFLYANNLHLPDKSQARVDGIYSQPDFFYEPDFHVFIDGSVHDEPEVKEKDRKIRSAILNRGEQCWTYRYDESLEERITERKDVFCKIR